MTKQVHTVPSSETLTDSGCLKGRGKKDEKGTTSAVGHQGVENRDAFMVKQLSQGEDSAP